MNTSIGSSILPCRQRLLQPHSVSQACHRYRAVRVRSFLESQPAWTLDQLAGIAFGGIMVASVFFASKVDDVVARSQRRELGLCEECGGLYNVDLCAAGKCPSRGKGAAQS
ncbi:hypothetical protein CVIRNUC_009058 [Coccomyxa viridis]|uniref:Uncharacterized protein n=1 Tax=Coccomyxa viridis TaxID=1274662 RepID=A0AAV1IGA6_9CHLO|nr:hypothetical protein CVIRNUC_009058 [Coccomyxa viridis]